MAKKAKRKPMTKTQVVAELAMRLNLSKAETKDTLEGINGLAFEEAGKVGSFTFPGLGKLVVVDRKARMGRNPATGEEIKIKAKRALKFRIAKAAKEEVLG